MLRKSKTTFSMKSKTDSESHSSDMKQKSGGGSERHSGTDQEWSSSGDPYHTAHGSSSRPSSSDVDVMLSAISDRGTSSMTTTTDYDAAHSHAESSSQHSSSYHTAASTLSSKSFSDKSGHLASFEHSETSDTLIDISIEQEDPRDDPGICTPQGQEILPHDDESDEGPVMGAIVRSPEMFFYQDKSDTLTGSIVTISFSENRNGTQEHPKMDSGRIARSHPPGGCLQEACAKHAWPVLALVIHQRGTEATMLVKA